MVGQPGRSKSPQFFKSCKVDSCKYVSKVGTKAVAVGYSSKSPSRSPLPQIRSSEQESHSSATYRMKKNMHVGMGQKPLVLYNPLSYRSRLPTPDFVPPYRNASGFEIGNRITCTSRAVFKTSNMALMNTKDFLDGLTNQGIISDKTKWFKLRSLD